jgi:hypothetical protein
MVKTVYVREKAFKKRSAMWKNPICANVSLVSPAVYFMPCVRTTYYVKSWILKMFIREVWEGVDSMIIYDYQKQC